MSTTAEIPVSIATGVFSGVGRRLLGDVETRESLDAYVSGGGYRSVDDMAEFLTAIDGSGIRGRGGAAFPLGRKIRTVGSGVTTPVAVANGEEGEPASVKDRWLMRHRPHLVLDGLRLAAAAVGADRLHVYVSDVASEQSILHALEESVGHGDWVSSIEVTRVETAYVAGEESAVVQVLNGGPALPTEKPPRPFEEGVEGRPTLISNVETLAQLALLRQLGVDEYRSLGTAGSPGTFLMTLSGATGHPGLYEIPLGTTLREILTWLGEDPSKVTGALMGGYFAGVVGAAVIDTPLDYDSVAAIGSGLGCGAVALLDADTCPVEVSSAVMTYFARENAGQCGSCFNGTAAMSAALQALRDFRATEADVERLRTWSIGLRGRGACGTLDGATNIAASVLREFPQQVAGHLEHRCEPCASGRRLSDPPFSVFPSTAH
ncbi:NADH-ubiquinone oxidoreductase-F iron-sulfur binding region domain-containing protein [Rhodococcoides yunnanense]|uniref:NADH-ubiquinone oxidoreductase-F iron-sulfur binding region domain-containing protein n=1 Tax=Rhodococcoides yunnanense TaxID=278209 RepID=UPI0009352884|nr:NADH-ubiquinone oxidoreductase-F iron-sulfur binding region domain-containing protein [Rhodococcus yunnanensis]